MTDVMHEQVDLDLDEERPARFRLQGEVFTLKQLSYRAFAAADRAFMKRLATIDEAADEATKRIQEAEDAAEVDDSEPQIDPADIAAQERHWAEQLDAFAEFVQANIVETDYDKFIALRDREEHGIQQRDMHRLRRWLWEAQLGRPLASPEASSPGPGSSEASSRDESGSPVVVRPS